MDIKMNKHTVVVFDLDDTLYNELDYLRSAYKSIAQFLEPMAWRPLYSKMFSLYRSNHNVFELLAQQYKIEIESLLNLYHNHQPEITLFDGVLEIFDAIKIKQGRIGIITDGRSKTQRAKLKSLKILKYIDKIIVSEEFGSEKPNILNFKAIESSVPGTDYFYIADNLKKDFIGPNALGWQCVALIDNGKNIHRESYKYMDAHNPLHFILDFKDLKII
ncbi:HAD family hydrolase [Gelidibacter salicanalis]|uniref:HAD family hydrolase n=2 Tax=Gelidibacter salicanalis TaxID=291193 RepID=A0A5C7AC09_9FLAO|nr:HAD family hydrolase [Gelidibacter salicanalis]